MRTWTPNMDTGKRYHDSSSEDENILRPIDEALEALKHLKKGLDKMESTLCLYETEYEPMGDPYDNREHPFKQQFGNTYQGK